MTDEQSRFELAGTAAARAGWLLVASGLGWAVAWLYLDVEAASPYCAATGLITGVTLLVAAGCLADGGFRAAVTAAVICVLFALAAAVFLLFTFALVESLREPWARMAPPARREYVACVLFWCTLGFAVALPCSVAAWRAAAARRVDRHRREPRTRGFEVIVRPPGSHEEHGGGPAGPRGSRGP